MENFVYYTPTKVFFGKGRENEAGTILADYKAKKVLVLHGGGFALKNGLLDRICYSIRKAGISYVVSGGIMPNPTMGTVLDLISLCRDEKADYVLAVGGGSVIDTAKAVCASVFHGDRYDVQIDPWKFFTKEIIPEGSLPLGVVLTIAAAGSEMSNSCVITNEKLAMKRGFGSDYNRPVFAIMNPELTFTVSPYQTGCGVADMIFHTMERFMYPSESACDLTDSISEALLRNIVSAGRIVMINPMDYDARATLMWASSLSHNGLTNAGKPYVLQLHQLAHEVSGRFPEVSHAAGLCALYHSWAQYVMNANAKRFERFAANVLDIKSISLIPLALHGINTLRNYFKDVLGMPVSLGELGIGSDSIEEMAEKCSAGRTKTISGIMSLDYSDILKIYRSAL